MTALTSLLSLDIPVGVGKQPTRDGTKPWVVIWPDAGVRSALTMQANDGAAETWVCHHYGLTVESAEVALKKMTAAVYALYRQQSADGRTVQFPEQLSAVPLQRDDTANPPLWDYVTEWRIPTSA